MADLAGRPTRAPGERRIGLSVALLVLLPTLTGCRSHPAVVVRPLGFSASGLDGGGFVNVIAFDPAVPGVVLAGGDVSGIARSTDYGQTWSPANTGVGDLAELKVASILFSSGGEAYAAVGDEGDGGGLLVSGDAGRTWSLRSDVPPFSGGNNEGLPIPRPHPRSTGALLALDEGRGLLYAATFDKGVMRSADDGKTWKTIGLAGAYLRGLAMDPGNPEILYAAAFGRGVYRTGSAATTGAFTRLLGSPQTVEEMTIVGSDLFAAAGSDGLFRSPDGGSTWTRLMPAGPVWEALAGYSACGSAVLYAGADGGGAQGLMRSTDGGTTWMSLVADAAGIHVEEGGPGGPTWWLAAQPGFLPGGPAYTASQIAVDPGEASGACLRPRVLVAGRSGIWGTTDAGTDWYPMVRGLAVTIVHATASDPAAPGDVMAALSDWGLLGSKDGGASFASLLGGAGSGFAVAVDANAHPAVFYVGTGSGDSGAGGGEVFAGAGASSRTWTPTGLAGAAGGRVLAVAAQRIGDRPVVLAAVEGQGVWRKDGDGSWTQVETRALTSPAAGGVVIAWPAGSTAYLYDRRTGLWRSSDAGTTWTKVWAQGSQPPFTGGVAADPSKTGRIYVSIGDDGLYRLDGADSGTVQDGQIDPARVGALPHPGPVTVAAGGAMYACELGVGGPPDLLASSDAGAKWRSVADASYRAAAVFPLGITVTSDGTVYVALDGNGLLIGRVAV